MKFFTALSAGEKILGGKCFAYGAEHGGIAGVGGGGGAGKAEFSCARGNAGAGANQRDGEEVLAPGLEQALVQVFQGFAAVHRDGVGGE